MNGAEALVRTLLAAGIDTCFANPGTSEMHLVAALDRVPGMRCVLGLFEGTVTGAADGYARMAGRPAATLLHLGPGFANGMANLHNAKKARTPIVNIVGEHALRHRKYDAPLSADVAGIAAPVSDWVRLSQSAENLGADVARAVAVATTAPGRIATLIVPADVAWSEGAKTFPPESRRAQSKADVQLIERAAEILQRQRGTALMIGGQALRGEALAIAARVAARTGARLLAPTNNARAERGAGRPIVERIPYPVADAVRQLQDLRHVILCGAPVPVAFFAYPGQPSEVLPPDASVLSIAGVEDDLTEVLEALEEAVGSRQTKPAMQSRNDAVVTSGRLTLEVLGTTLTALMPENAVLVEEAITSGFVLLPLLHGAAPHDHLQLTGGSIGIGPPLALGAAIGAPERKVVCLQADGSAMYSLQALWSQAREQTDIVTIILANRTYATLRLELANVGVENPGATALSMLDLGNPTLDWVGLAKGLGVEAARATTAEEFNRLLEAAFGRHGPFLIEAVIP